MRSIRQPVLGEGGHRRLPVGQAIVLLLAQRSTAGVDADGGPGELQRPAGTTAPGLERPELPLVPGGRADGGLVIDFRPGTIVYLHPSLQRQELEVARFHDPPIHLLVNSGWRTVVGDGVGGTEEQCVAALAEAQHQQGLARAGSLQCRRQHEQRVGATGVAASGGQVVGQSVGRDT